MSDASDRVSPFSNGTEYYIWLDANCERPCRKCYDHENQESRGCEIEEALSLACVTGGAVSREIAARAGLDRPWNDRPRCPEFEPIGTHDDTAPVIRPATGQMTLFGGDA